MLFTSGWPGLALAPCASPSAHSRLLDLGHAAEALELEDFLLLGLLRCLHVTRGLGVGCTGCAGWELRLAELAELAARGGMCVLLTCLLFCAYYGCVARLQPGDSELARELNGMRKRRGAGAGRPRKPSNCLTCGARCDSRREADAHCMSSPRPRRDRHAV